MNTEIRFAKSKNSESTCLVSDEKVEEKNNVSLEFSLVLKNRADFELIIRASKIFVQSRNLGF